MADPTVTELRKLARKRSKLLRQSESGLMSRASTMERKLNRYVLDTLLPKLEISDSNTIRNTTANLNKVNKATGLKKFMKNVVNVEMFKFYDTQFNKITGATERYFNPFEPTDATKKRIVNRGTAIVDGFVDELFDNNQITRAIQQTVRNAVTSEQNKTDLSTLLTEQIKGKEKKLGLISSYHAQNGRDEFQTYARSLDQEFSTALGLNYAIYAGGEIKSTRDFCEERNGNVYNRETILSWNHTPSTWQGRKDNNNILIDMGGYNCRHDFDWISFALAKRIDSSIEKSKFDKR